MSDIIHICRPEIIETSIRLIPKNKRQFIEFKFTNLKQAIDYGLQKHKSGFRIYRQNCYEWYEPTNILLAKIENISEDYMQLENGVPAGWQEIKDCAVHINDEGTKLVITGQPITEGDSGHNCDMMGCGSIDHVIYRATITLFGR